ncbi:leucine-rich repeat-containing protein 49 isoform X2 [Xenopus laevis]|uniref:Leucine-rich repeat-containing protein 49 isoform X2 n=1 Tax=Xenopus laevis TaxID=8355 RepID=A0A8J0US26_XENLA|nr:leucine-rich repeat-containing protein 49 isoform X2 [Xenopus laevis]
MLPGKYRGRLVPNAFEFRLSKEASLGNRINLQDVEKNSSKNDGRHSSPMVGNKPTYIPLATNVTEVFGSAPKHGRESLSLGAFTELPIHLSTKPRSRAGYHSANPKNNCEDTHPSKDNLNFLRQLSRLEPGIAVVRRTAEEKAASPDKLSLESQNLTACPIIEDEEQLRLLYFQHNFITRIQKLSNLQHLIFLDLYDNQIQEISGLSSLRALRVLMLGKNRIQKISNLENLKHLDVLDLHGNQISKIENVSHLRELRVLNLARNQINQVENINGLDSLTELNLRDNKITVLRDVDTLPSLQLLYLSFNNISRINDILCLADSTSLSDVTLDGNPIAQESWYRQTILGHMLQLRQLDMKRITEEERRTASLLARKEDERKRESHKQALLKEKKRIAICNAARQWDIQQNRVTPATLDQENGDCVSSYNKPCKLNGSTAFELTEEQRSLDTVLYSAVQGLSVIDSHLVEVEGDVLFLYGSGSLDSLDRPWSVQTAGSVSTISFTFINFDEIVQVLPKFRLKFPNISHLKFKETNLFTLHQFDALAQLRKLDQLTVDSQGNPVVNFTLWKYYVLFRLNSFGIQKINDFEVTQNDIVMSEKLFGILAYVASSELPQYRIFTLLGESRKKPFRQLLEGKSKKNPATGEEINDNRKVVGESPSRATLNYIPQDLLNEKLEEIKEKKSFCHSYVQDLVNEAADISLKNESLQKLWPQMFIELVRDAVIEVRDKNSYMKQCLQRICEQK